jgi:hypothetical protein
MCVQQSLQSELATAREALANAQDERATAEAARAQYEKE